MGPEDKNQEMVAYCDGRPVGYRTELPEITVDAAKAVAAAAAISAVLVPIGIVVEKVAAELAAVWGAIMAEDQFRTALRWAEAFNRPLAHRYHHTKKGRTRKKYAKRIMAWYQEEATGL